MPRGDSLGTGWPWVTPGWPCCPQKRRVAELLASAIPEDEALLLRDGR